MNKKIVGILLVVAMLLVAVVPALGAGHETIVEIAVGDDSFDTLVAAVTAAGLADELSGGEWTVFAPTDAAFAKLGLNASNITQTFSEKELVDILLYHVIPMEISSTEAIANQGDIAMANGELAGIKYFQGSLYVNDDAKVITPDILASNGVIHVVDTVILGPWPREGDAGEEIADMPGDTIVDIASGNDNFDTLVAAVTAAGLADELSSGEWTVFAPTDAAFAELGLDADNIADAFSQAELTDILLYHAIPSAVTSAEAKANQGNITMANGELAGIKWFQGNLFVNDDAKVVTPDIIASNGVIHVVDNVILGPWPKDAATDAE